MASGPPCPQCGTEVQPGWDWCHRCGFDPENLRPAGGAAPPAPAPFAPMGSPPAAPPVPTRSGPGVQQVLSITLVVVVALAALGGVAWFVLSRDHTTSASSSTTSTLPPAVSLVPANGPDGSYTIGFPGRQLPPEALPQAEPGQQVIGWSEENAFDPAAGRAYLVLSMAAPRSLSRADQLRGLDAMAAEFATDPSSSSIETTFQGYPARRYSATIGGKPSSGVALVTDTHIYLILSTGPNPDAERQAVEASFHLTPAPPG